jgi:WD40 repeat protein
MVAPAKPILPPTNLTQVPSVLDRSLPFINDDVLMTSGIDGQVYLWDRRVSGSESHGYVRKLEVPKTTSPWTASASWALDGRSVFVGRRNNTVDLYDLRFVRPASPIFNPASALRSIKLPSSSGPVSCVKAWPDGAHLLCASFDNLRLYNLNADPLPTSSARKPHHQPPKIPFKIIPGHSSGVVSQMCMSPLFTSWLLSSALAFFFFWKGFVYSSSLAIVCTLTLCRRHPFVPVPDHRVRRPGLAEHLERVRRHPRDPRAPFLTPIPLPLPFFFLLFCNS